MSVFFILMPPNKFKDQTNGVIATTQHEKKKSMIIRIVFVR